jgi:regulatory protein
VKRRAGAKSGTRTLTAALTVDALEAVALRYLTGRDRTEAQLRAHLLRKGASSTSLRLVIRRLLDHGYLNDEAYARRWAESRLAQRPMGRSRLEAELSSRGVPLPIMAQVLDRLYAEEDEARLAYRLLARRTSMPARMGEAPGQIDSRRFARMAGMLRRYGFSHDTIATVLGEPENRDA